MSTPTVLIARPLWPVLRRVAPFLTAAGYQVEEAPSWSRLLDPQLLCPELSGVLLGDHGDAAEEMRLVRRFRERDGAVGVPLILVGGFSVLRRAGRFRASGVDEVLSADIPAESLAEKVAPLLRHGSLYQALLAANRSLRDRALLDDLTGLPNRRSFSMDLARNVEMARRIGRPLSCIIVDIDDLKKVNDAYGRAAGDQLIREFATALSQSKRAYDTVSRLGGDEFGWLLVDADPAQALHAAGRAHAVVKERVFVLEPGPVRVTATFGVSSVSPGVELSGEHLVGNADRALYWGKESGKDVVRFYPANKEHPNAAADSHLS